jgi:hypothetical protein
MSLLAAAVLSALLPAAPSPAATSNLVQVIVTTQQQHPMMPWQSSELSRLVGYGMVLDDKTVITTEHLIRNAKFIELRRPRTGAKIPATVRLSDSQVNLALLDIGSGAGQLSFGAIAGAGPSRKRQPVTILQFDETSQAQEGDGQIVQVMMAPLSDAPYASLACSVLTDLNVNGEGAPVIADGQLAGLMMSYSRGERVGHMVPQFVMERFLERARIKPYPGFASAGFGWASLVDPVKRRYLGVGDHDRGIMVLTVLPRPGGDVGLKPNDVVLTWDGRPVDNMGFYEDPDFGRMDLSCLIKMRGRVGDEATVGIVRDRKPMDVRISLVQREDAHALIPEDLDGKPVEYLIEGGLVIRELTGRYLHAHGTDWRRSADPRLVNVYLSRKLRPEKPGDRVVILSMVLPDPINVGYQDLFNRTITALNGKPVRNMGDVFRIATQDGAIERIAVEAVGVDLVLDRDALPAANARIARNYGIPRLFHKRTSDRGEAAP